MIAQACRARSRLLWMMLWVTATGSAAPDADPPPQSAARVAGLAPAALESGLPPLQRFTPQQYRAHPMNWAVAQDARGVIYLGNGEGVLEFDGQRWRLIRVGNRTVVRSLATDRSGQIHVGAVGEIGLLAPDPEGSMRYVSLLDQLPAEMRDFADVWDTLASPNGTVFVTDRRLVRIGPEGTQSWTTDTEFHRAFAVDGRVFVRESGRGLIELTAAGPHLVAAGERFAEEKIYAMLPWQPAQPNAPSGLLIGTRTQGLFVLQAGQLSAWPTQIDASLDRDLLYAGARTADGTLALGTLLGGVYLLDPDGRRLGQLSKANGLPDSGIIALGNDREGGLWITSDNGVARVDTSGPLTRFDDRNGLIGTSFSVHRHAGRLFAGTAQGLFRLRPGPDAHFERIAGIDGQVWALQSVGPTLLVANYQGVYSVTGDAVALVRGVDGAYALHASQIDPQRVYVGLRNGLTSLRWTAGQWQAQGRVAGLGDEVRSILEDPQGRLWLGSYSTGVVRVSFSADAEASSEHSATIEHFAEADGLPSRNNDWVYPYWGEPRFVTTAGIYLFDEAQRRFLPDPDFATLFAQPRQILSLQEAPGLGAWMYTKDNDSGVEEAGLALRGDHGRHRWESQALRATTGRGGEGMQRIHHDADGVVWFAGAEGLLRFDPRIRKRYDLPFDCLLRQVVGGSGRILYGGSGEAAAPTLAYADNRLRFEFAAASLDSPEALHFQVWLEGSEAGWSDWSSENYKDYNNLPEGDYRFRVRARTRYDTVSSEASYAFTVLPPWYRTLWAYLSYALAIGSAVWVTLRLRLQRLREQKRAQETLVAERTRQLSTLGEVGRAITAQLDLDAALDTLYAQLNQLLDEDVFSIGLYHRDRGDIEFRLVVERGRRSDADRLRRNRPDPLAMQCVEQRRPVLVTDRSADDPRRADADQGLTPRSLMYVPLLLKGEAIGVISVQSFKARAYQASHLDILQTLAAYAVTAIENARVLSELARSHQDLIAAQRQLVMQEKMASLGQLVAGVAHEVNTPLGVALTTSSHLEQRTEDLRQQIAQGALTRSALDRYLALAAEGAAMISRNLTRAAALVQSFKQVSVDQSSDGRRLFEVGEFLDDLLRSLNSLWRARPIEVSAACAPGITLDGFPGALGQVLTVLIQNSLMHAFAEGQRGQIRIRVDNADDGSVLLSCSDDGGGIDQPVLAKIFEPFFTTRRNAGGTGLGLHIAFNLVTQKLGGEIEVESSVGAGATFLLRLPRRAPV